MATTKYLGKGLPNESTTKVSYPQPQPQPTSVFDPRNLIYFDNMSGQFVAPKAFKGHVRQKQIADVPNLEAPVKKNQDLRFYTPDELDSISKNRNGFDRFLNGDMDKYGEFHGGYGDAIKLGADVGMSAYNIWDANRNFNLMEDEFQHQKDMDAMNMQNQVLLANRQLDQQKRIGMLMDGKSQEQVAQTLASDEYKKKNNLKSI